MQAVGNPSEGMGAYHSAFFPLSTVSDNQNYLFSITQISSGLAVLRHRRFLETPLYIILSFLKHLSSLFAIVSDAAWLLSEPSEEGDKEEEA